MKLIKEKLAQLWCKITCVCLYFIKIYIKIRWSCWNPWALGRMNLAWSKYAATPMYEARRELDREFAKNIPNYKGDFSYEAFLEYHEFDFFYSQRTLFDRVRLFFAPFSFSNKFRMPTWRIRWWWYGIDENEL